MAPRSKTTHNEGLVKKPGPDVDKSRRNQNNEDEGLKMSVTQKLLLSSELWGMEASCAFEHLYTVPVSRRSMFLSFIKFDCVSVVDLFCQICFKEIINLGMIAYIGIIFTRFVVFAGQYYETINFAMPGDQKSQFNRYSIPTIST